MVTVSTNTQVVYWGVVASVHMLADGLSSPLDWTSSEWQQARTTYLNNITYAADECAKVRLSDTHTVSYLGIMPKLYSNDINGTDNDSNNGTNDSNIDTDDTGDNNILCWS